MTMTRTALVVMAAFAPLLSAQTRPPRSFESHCAICHGPDAGGSDRAPGILPFVGAHSDDELVRLVRTGRAERGMPKFDFNDAEMKTLTGLLRGRVAGAAISPAGPARGGRGGGPFQPRAAALKLENGAVLDGMLTSLTAFGATLLTPDGKLHLLARNGETYTEKPLEPKRDWLGYDGSDTGNRYSSLEQITTTNVKQLGPAWIFPVPGAPRLEVTPIVADGVMYLTGPNEAYAVDATTGRQIWAFRTPRTQGLLSEAGGGANRGLALSGNRLFMVTDNAHLLALDKLTGRKLWDATMGDTKEGYSATSTPLVVGDLVLSGIAGGEEGARGFVDAYRAATGEHAWRFWTIPTRGEKEAETWVGNALEHGCGATWVTGSYDAELGLTYWTTGNPCPDFNGDERKGDNLYTNSVVALDVKTGKLKWYYQFTPHDTHDWDATGPLILTDQMWEGQLRKLVVHADVNGFLFVLDRTNGKLLRASPLGNQNWTTGYGADGRPVPTANYETTMAGISTCKAGAPKWASAAFEPVQKVYITRITEGCQTIRKDPAVPEMGQRFFGGSFGGGTGNQSFIQAVDVLTGAKKWAYPLVAGGGTGTLATAGGLVFFGETGGTITAVNSTTGLAVWHFETGQGFRASPMTYMVGGRQYMALAGDGGIFSFALVP